MRTEGELQEAIATLAASFARPVKHGVWGHLPGARREAWVAFEVLLWMMGARSGFQDVLEYATLKLERQAQHTQEEEKNYVSQ